MMCLNQLKENPIDVSKKLDIKTLEKIINVACKKYYEEDTPIISDGIYDIL